MNRAHRTPDPADLLRAAIAGEEKPPTWQAPTLDALAAAFPELTVHERIGQGGMAAVYRATQTRLQRPVALKVMRPDLAAEPRFAERFVREARALAALANPHVLSIHDFGERNGFCYLVTEYVDGANLRELMRMGQLSPPEVLRIVPQICAGLHFAHQHGVVHRDIKPENVLVDRQGLVKLADFGLAKLAGDGAPSSLTQTNDVFGTPHYMAPEQWRGSAAVDHRADIYSLGVVLYELLTGRLPVGSYAPASAQPGVPPGIDDVVQRSLQQEPERRYQSARDVQRDLEREGRAGDAARSAGAAQRGVGRLLAAAALVLLVGFAGFAVLVWQRHLLTSAWVDFHQREESAAAAMNEVRVTVAAGKAWTGALPAEPVPPPQTLLQSTRVEVLVAAWVGSLALLLAVIVAAGVRRTAFADSPRSHYLIARIAALAPLLVPAGCLLGEFASHYATASNGFVPLLAIVAAAVGMFFLGRALWSASGRRGPGVPRPLGIGVQGIAVLGTLLAGACVAYAAVAAKIDWSLEVRSSVRVPVPANSLVGKTRLQVLDALGPPPNFSVSGDTMVWGYVGIDGRSRTDVFEFRNDIVARTQYPTIAFVPEPRPEALPYVGQSMQEVVARFGAPLTTEPFADGTKLTFPNGLQVTLRANGIVARVQW